MVKCETHKYSDVDLIFLYLWKFVSLAVGVTGDDIVFSASVRWCKLSIRILLTELLEYSEFKMHGFTKHSEFCKYIFIFQAL